MIYNMRSPKERINGQELFLEEIGDAGEEIRSRAHLVAFPEEYMALLTGKEIAKKSSLRKLCLWLDDQSASDVVVDFNLLNVFRTMLCLALNCQGVSGGQD